MMINPLVTLRLMTPADLVAVHQIEIQLQVDPWSLQIFTDCLRVGYPAWVLCHNGIVVGFGVITIAAGEAHLLNLAVAPAMQGQGLAKRLLTAMISYCQQQACTRMYLEVRPSNPGAIHLYETFGFCQDGVRPNYYITADGREDALLYSLRLS